MLNAETVKAKVAEWNEEYLKMRLGDLSPEAYEAEVSYAILDICDNDVDLALAVFEHPDNAGGWMYGNVPAFLKKKQASK